MKALNTERLREELIKIYESYSRNPEDETAKTKARKIYSSFMNAMPLLDENMRHAVNLLVAIGWQTGQKPSGEVILSVIKSLKH
ncbi:MAG: hypothetical protein HYW27_03990 [Candidatus Aenigmarchaeota archaeon]|nr:hypothetical protein [Candidatus Aenigmarchaeota archaeon]